MHAALAVLDRARHGQGGVVLIEGEPGIGKSRLVEEIVAVARRERFQVLDVACEMAEQATPFAPVRRLLGVGGPFPGDAATTDPDHEATPALRFRVVEALGALVESVAARDPLVVAIDDLQWADESTLLTVRSLGPRIGPLPAVLVGTNRPGHGIAELHRLTEAMLRGGALRLELGPLDDESAAALAAAVGGEPSESLRTRLRGAAGNPLFIIELARAVSDAETPPDSSASDTVPAAFRQSVLRRLGQLPSSVQDLLRIAAVLGSSFDARHLSIVLGRSAVDLAPLIDQAMTAGVIEERRDQLGFKHDLVREAVYENVPVGVRRELHREVGRLLADAATDVLVVAQHVALGADRVDADAAAWLRRAATEASPFAPAVAADLLERARALLPPSSPDLTDVLADLALAYAWSGRMADAEALARDVLSGRVDPGRATVMRAGLLRALTWQGRPAEALAQVGLQVDEPADGFDAAMLAAETALAATLAFDFPRALPAVARAEQLARASGNEVALCQVLSVQAWLTMFLGRPHESVELVHEALAIADASPGGSAHRAHPCFCVRLWITTVDSPRRASAERNWSLPRRSWCSHSRPQRSHSSRTGQRSRSWPAGRSRCSSEAWAGTCSSTPRRDSDSICSRTPAISWQWVGWCCWRRWSPFHRSRPGSFPRPGGTPCSLRAVRSDCQISVIGTAQQAGSPAGPPERTGSKGADDATVGGLSTGLMCGRANQAAFARAVGM